MTSQYRFDRCRLRATEAWYAYVGDELIGVVQKADIPQGRSIWKADQVWDRRFQTREEAADALLERKRAKALKRAVGA